MMFFRLYGIKSFAGDGKVHLSKAIIPAFSLLLLLASCSWFRRDDSEQPNVIARAYDKSLYDTDIATLVLKGTSKKDSQAIVTNYINNWLKQQVVLKKAEDNLTDQQKEVSRKLEEYRNSLITYIYESELIRQKLDTVVSEEEIEKYYNDNQSNFLLKNNIVKASFIKLPSSAPKIEKVRDWYKSQDPADSNLILEYCHQYAIDYFVAGEEWMPFDELLKRVPIKTYDKEEYLRNNRYIEISDSSAVYFVNIKGFKIKESVSPLSFEHDNIRAMIVNKRKLELIEAMEHAAFNDALKNNDIKIYGHKN